MDKKLNILVTNDDGINAKGLKALVGVARKFGNVTVVAPTEGQSGMSHAITVKIPIRVYKIEDEENLKTYTCNGTPVDCVKMAFNRLMPQMPDLVLSGINHGGNASSSVIYSGTMAAAIEGSLYNIPSIGFSLLDFSRDADFTAAMIVAEKIINQVLHQEHKPGLCLNVNIPVQTIDKIKGINVCRQNHGVWREEFEHRKDPNGYDYFWLTGAFEDMEPQAEDTDEWSLRNNYVSVVPVQFDLTAYRHLSDLKKWNF